LCALNERHEAHRWLTSSPDDDLLTGKCPVHKRRKLCLGFADGVDLHSGKSTRPDQTRPRLSKPGSLQHQLATLAGQSHEAVRAKSSACSLSKLRVSLSRTISKYSSCSSAVSMPAALLRASSSTRGTKSSRTAFSAVSSKSRVCLCMCCLTSPDHAHTY